MITVIVDQAISQVYLNTQLIINMNTGGNYSESAGSYCGTIGMTCANYYQANTVYSFEGFVWSFIIHNDTTSQSLYYADYGYSCFPGLSCITNCSPGIVDSFLGKGCPPLNQVFHQNAAGVNCPNSLLGCSGNTALKCNCIPNSCIMSSNSNLCYCNAGYGTRTTSCLANCNGYVNSTSSSCHSCESSCATCSTSLLCTSCIANYALPDVTEGCACMAGYYGTKPLNSTDSCLPCKNNECSICNSSSYACVNCIAINASPNNYTNSGCVCNKGFFGTFPLNTSTSCIACYRDCATCNASNICLTCITSNAILYANHGCVCKTGYYNTSALNTLNACIACMAGCATCANNNNCLTCIALNATPASGAGLGCYCNQGYYGNAPLTLSTSCSPCNSNCQACTKANICTSCITQNASPTTTVGCACNPKFYNTTSLNTLANCLSCNSQCATCNQSNICLTCIMSNASPDATIGCTCNPGYYLLGTSCSACKVGCTCTSSNHCISCIANNAILNNNGNSNNGNCICKSGFYNAGSMANSTACPACYVECATCNQQSICLTCIAANATVSANLGCSCNAGFYGLAPLNSSNSCSVCYSDCKTCNQAKKCIACKTSNASPDPTVGCICKSGFYNNTLLTLPGSCLACYSDCFNCTNATICLSCLALNASPTTPHGCACNHGYYNTAALSISTSCIACYLECATCNQANKCLTCIDTNASPNSNLGCTCKSEYYGKAPLSSSGSCIPCSSDCTTCNSTGYCAACKATNAVQNSLNGCSCKAKYYGISPLNTSTSCMACYQECATCSQSNICLICITSNSTPSLTIGCVCNSGFYNISPLTLSTSCLPCNSNCINCTASGCISCKASNASVAVNGCKCNTGFYNTSALNSSTSCIPCYSECATCNQANKCLTCIANNSTPNLSTGIGCKCNDGYYGIAPLLSQGSCMKCSSECTLCNSSGACLNCTAQNAVPSANNGCSCSARYYGISPLNTSSSCTACYKDCATCSQANLCLTCLALNSTPNSIIGCQCNAGYYNITPLTTSSSCINCNSDCKACTQADLCTICIASSALPSKTKGCTCISGYYSNSTSLSLSNSCIPCYIECATCNNSLICMTCISQNAQPSSIKGCSCNNGYGGNPPLALSYSCSQCYNECGTCTSINICQTCISLNAIPSKTLGCVCNTGYYNISALTSNTSCIQCSSQCKSCNQTSCIQCIAMNSLPNITATQTCSCINGYFPNGALTTTSSCISCYPECATCNQSSICLTCISSNASPDIVKGGCNCNVGYGSNNSQLTTTNSCAQCYLECLECSQINICKTCVSAYAIPDAIIGCNCIDGYWGVSLLINDNSCIKCYEECATCNETAICLTCIDPNASPNNTQGCDCNVGYYAIGPLINNSSCLACASDCATCNEKSICLTCKYNNTSPLPSGGCSCIGGFYNTSVIVSSDSCINCNENSTSSNCFCDSSCYGCNGKGYYECSSCTTYYLDGMCFDNCPLGYLSNQHACNLIINNTAPVVQFTFGGSGTVFKDGVNNLEAFIVFPNNSRRLTVTYPVTAYLRGIYFPGTGYLKLNQTSQLFGSSFSISIWINPIQSNSILLSKADFDIFLFNLTINSYSLICFEININTTIYSLCSLNAISLNQWNHILATIEFSNGTYLFITVNELNSPSKFLSAVPFKDNTTVPLLIGSNLLSINSYVGFIYSIEIFAITPLVNTLVNNSACNDCSVCLSSLQCIANCDIHSYFSLDTQACVSCSDNCTSTCRNKFNCSMCLDQNCLTCSSYQEKSCTECIAPYVVVDSLCTTCGNGVYYNSNTKSCTACPPLCITCSSQNACGSCIGNSSLDFSISQCQCNLGYSGVNNCTRKFFYVSMAIDQSNNVTLYFTEALQTVLSSATLLLSISGTNLNYQVTLIDVNTYELYIDFSVDISSSSVLLIAFPGDLVSIYNSLLLTPPLTTHVFADAAATQQAQKALQSQAAAAKTLSSTGTQVGGGVSLGASLASFEPSSIFNFLNTAEMFYAVYLFNLDLYPVLSEFLIGMRIQSKFPNIYSYLFNENKGISMETKYEKFGYSTNLILRNVGVQFTMLSLTFIIFLIIQLLNRITWFKNKLQWLTVLFKYGAFLRFWIQTYFEFSVASTLCVKYYNFENFSQLFNFIFCIMMIVKYN